MVVEIFNRVNSGGTKLSKGDLARAKICAAWPEARQEMKKALAAVGAGRLFLQPGMAVAEYHGDSDGEALFSVLRKVTPDEFRAGLAQVQNAYNYLLNMISGRLGLDHDRVLGGRYAFPVMARYLVLRGGKLQDARERDRLLFWYVHSFLGVVCGFHRNSVESGPGGAGTGG